MVVLLTRIFPRCNVLVKYYKYQKYRGFKMKIKKIARLGVAFTLSLSSLLTVVTPVAHAAGPFTCTWTGGGSDANFSTAANWSGCNGAAPQPADGDTLIFGDTPTSPNNDLVGATFGVIVFNDSGSPVVADITGNDFTLTSGITQTTGSGNIAFIHNNVALSGAVSVDVTSGSYVELDGNLSGSGSIAKDGAGWLTLTGDNSSYSGNITVNGGTLSGSGANALGDTTGTTTVNSGADLYVGDCSAATVTIPENITLTGASSNPAGTTPTPKLQTAANTCSGSAGYDEVYGGPKASGGAVTLSGSIALGSDVTFGSSAATTTLTGDLTGGNSISLVDGYTGALVVNSSSNGSSTANGTYTPAAIAASVSDDQPSKSVLVQGNSTLTVDGTRSDVTVDDGGTLKGNGTVGLLFVNAGGTIAPGHSPGCISSQDLTLSGAYQVEVGGTTACSGYDQLKVTGTVDVTNGTLSTALYNGFVPSVGHAYTIIDNDSNDAVTGTFNGLAEGASFTAQGVTYRVTYVGGDGNDVVLTVTAVDAAVAGAASKAPNTGFQLLATHPAVGLLVSIVAAGAIAISASRLRTIKR
jgi:autotransporter-associated beta strand protein